MEVKPLYIVAYEDRFLHYYLISVVLGDKFVIQTYNSKITFSSIEYANCDFDLITDIFS